MPKYDDQGRIEFYSLDELTRIFAAYADFLRKKDAFFCDRERNSIGLIQCISSLRQIDTRVRGGMPAHLGIHDSELTSLELECRKYLPNQAKK